MFSFRIFHTLFRVSNHRAPDANVDIVSTILRAAPPPNTQPNAPSPDMLYRHDSLAALSVAADPNAHPSPGELKWPTGWRPYACLFGGFLLMFNSWGLVNAYGTYSSYYMQHLLPHSDILLLNLVGSTESFVVLMLSAIVGRFLDAGYSRTLIITGTILVTIGEFCLSTVNGNADYNEGNYGLIWLTQGLVTGLGMACFFVTSSQVVATWFKAKKGLAIGIVASGASIAGLVYPMMAKYLMLEIGFNNSTRCVAAVVAITSALAIAIARPNPAHQIRKPERWANIRVFFDSQAFRNAAFVWLTAAICFLFLGFYAVFFNLEEWAASTRLGYKDPIPSPVKDASLPETIPDGAVRTFVLLSTMNAASTLGRLSSAYLCDHFGALNVHAVVTFVASLLLLFFWTFVDTVPAALAFVVLFGIFSGAVIGLPPASMAYVLGPDPAAQAKLGQWTGMMYSTAAVFALAGPVIAGQLITTYEDYLTVQCWTGGCLLLSAVCMSCAIVCKRRKANQEESFNQKRRRLSFGYWKNARKGGESGAESV